eukprot:2860607-Rhodomonas_salina.1
MDRERAESESGAERRGKWGAPRVSGGLSDCSVLRHTHTARRATPLSVPLSLEREKQMVTARGRGAGGGHVAGDVLRTVVHALHTVQACLRAGLD